MKTFEDVLAGNSLPDIGAMIAAHTKRIAVIDAETKKRESKTGTVDEMAEWDRLDNECDQLTVKAAERQAARVKAINTPVGGVPFQADNLTPDPATPSIELSGVASVKNIRGVTPREAELKAYRIGRFFMAALFNHRKSIDWCLENGVELFGVDKSGQVVGQIKAQIENVNEYGGVLVPPEFDRTLIDLRERYGVLRREAKVVPMGSDVKVIPRRATGLTAYWVGEAQEITRSTKTWDSVQLVAKKLAVLVAYSTELNEDAIINLGDDLADEIAYQFALKEDQAGFNGDGTSTYGGIVGLLAKILGLSGTIANIAGLKVGTGNLYSEIVLNDFIGTAGLLPVYADTTNTKWFMHKSVYYNVAARLEAAAGGVTAAEIREGFRRPMFLGYPVEFVQVMPSVEANSQVMALFGDIRLAATLGDRRRTTLFTDPYSLSSTDMIQLRGTERVDINVHDVGNADATAANRVAGPVVGLITAAS
jgi:HK97 family phage major capsid protein